MKENVLKYSLYLAGIICFTIFILVRFDHLPQSLIVDLDKYGDLYRLNYINRFKQELPEKKRAFIESEKQASIKDADILIFGDSFFNYRRHKSVPEQIADAFNKKVFFKQSHFVDLFLHQCKYDTSKRKVLILEIAERGIPVMFNNFSKSSIQFQFDLFTKLDTTFFAQKYNDRYRFLLERSKPTHAIYSALNSFGFNQFGAISRSTPRYNRDSGWLFYESTVNNMPGSYNYEYSNEEMNIYVENIINWRDLIESKYNVEVLLYFIPNKSSIYHSEIYDDSYNNFLPQLSKALNLKYVKHISLYDDFISSSESLYYPTDTHWNEKGEKIGANKVINYLKEFN